MSNKTTKKLSLNKETIKYLSDAQLADLNGGAIAWPKGPSEGYTKCGGYACGDCVSVTQGIRRCCGVYF
ncbi:MAG: rSAM-modified peptide [Deltaproteobacteria bacterium]|nr:rSAM-modified peptide [Deltaproteobacteria bacterium]